MSTDELYYQAIDLLKELIETPSISREENNAANVLEHLSLQKSNFQERE